MKFRVPESFEIYGSTIKVRRVPDSGLQSNYEYAHWDSHAQEIEIRYGLTADADRHSFLHEWFHAAFEASGYPKLSTDEVLVDTMAGLLAQMLKTAR